ncbi:ATP-dependent helicase [Ruthenibacterium lactatiformans]|uniref:ATP-dependent helicase n=1 Tax=Ruthenibacterium lactatiformans TaxID=1550024 RepID=UPI00210DBEC3|nr:UvrD-helicase domain-containing protein [Ruthenibacterium lactatiformans]MCQ5087578.1 UvrD-helicase domain-containing protein [Ruthenibacterium lactatiformans]
MESQFETQFLALRKKYIEAQFGKLNPVQRDAVFTTDGPLLILAGAGSGKTTVLVNRIANLIRFGSAHSSTYAPQGAGPEQVAELERLLHSDGEPSEALRPFLREHTVRPYNVLAITFTNKAAGELKNRLSAMLGEAGQDVNASTFHSACVRILRREAGRLGYPQSFTIYDTDDQQRAMKEVYKSMNIDDKFLPLKSAIGAIGRLKDKMVSPQDAMSAPADTRAGLVAKVYGAYQKRLLQAGAFDFDDLIYATVKLLRDFEDVREYYQNRFRYILVDEYQDTSVAQFQLVYLLGGEHRNVCVVGDDDQSIYRFRGATIENILNFEQHFPGAKVIRLEQNYRSTSNILNAANCVIKNNMGRKGKTLWTENGNGEKLMCYEADSEFDEAAHVAAVIGQNVKKGAKLRDHAILYRMNAQSGPIETYFARAGIPYKIVGGQRFYDRKEIKDMLAYMSIVANEQDDLRLRRIINEPARKIGATTVQNVADIAAGLGVSMLEVVEHAPDYPALARASAALGGFWRIYRRLKEAYDTLPLDVFVSEILEITGYRSMLEAEGEEGQTRMENIGQLVSSVKTYADQRGPEASLPGFLEEVALISDIDSYDEGADVVVLMTMHAAKGLEFNYVFIVGLEEGIFPSEMSRYSNEDLEEERRLCYVGITRAKKELYLSCANSRMLFGQTKHNRPSRFLEEIDASLVEVEQSPAAAQMKAMRQRYMQQQNAYLQPEYGAASMRSTVQAGYSARYGGASHSSGAGGASRPARQRASVGGGFSTVQAGSAASVPRTEGSGAYRPGDLVEHKVFGRGEVLKVTPVAGDTIVEIRFDTAGVKKTMANYAPLKHISE